MNDFGVLKKLFYEMSTYSKSFKPIKSNSKDGSITIRVIEYGYIEDFQNAIVIKENKIVSLDLNGRDITFIPPCIGELKNLEELNLSENRINRLPDGISKLSKLKKLFLSSNNLKSLPISLLKIKNLSILHLSNNQIKSLPRKVSKLINLVELIVSSNYLGSIPKEMLKMENLRLLDLRYNSGFIFKELSKRYQIQSGNELPDSLFVDPIVITQKSDFSKKQYSMEEITLIKDEKILKNIFLNSTNREINEYIFPKLKNPKYLHEIATKIHPKYLCSTPNEFMGKISNKQILEDIRNRSRVYSKYADERLRILEGISRGQIFGDNLTRLSNFSGSQENFNYLFWKEKNIEYKYEIINAITESRYHDDQIARSEQFELDIRCKAALRLANQDVYEFLVNYILNIYETESYNSDYGPYIFTIFKEIRNRSTLIEILKNIKELEMIQFDMIEYLEKFTNFQFNNKELINLYETAKLLDIRDFALDQINDTKYLCELTLQLLNKMNNKSLSYIELDEIQHDVHVAVEKLLNLDDRDIEPFEYLSDLEENTIIITKEKIIEIGYDLFILFYNLGWVTVTKNLFCEFEDEDLLARFFIELDLDHAKILKYNHKITNQKLLYKIAISTEYEMRKNAVKRISNYDLLLKLAQFYIVQGELSDFENLIEFTTDTKLLLIFRLKLPAEYQYYISNRLKALNGNTRYD